MKGINKGSTSDCMKLLLHIVSYFFFIYNSPFFISRMTHFSFIYRVSNHSQFINLNNIATYKIRLNLIHANNKFNKDTLAKCSIVIKYFRIRGSV